MRSIRSIYEELTVAVLLDTEDLTVKACEGSSDWKLPLPSLWISVWCGFWHFLHLLLLLHCLEKWPSLRHFIHCLFFSRINDTILSWDGTLKRGQLYRMHGLHRMHHKSYACESGGFSKGSCTWTSDTQQLWHSAHLSEINLQWQNLQFHPSVNGTSIQAFECLRCQSSHKLLHRTALRTSANGECHHQM